MRVLRAALCHVGTRARAGEDVVVARLDALEDAGVERARRRHAPRRRRRQQRYAAVGLRVERPVALDLEAHELAPRRRHPARVRVGAEAAQVLLRHVDAAAVEVLADVAQEVGQLEGQPEGPRRARARRGRAGAAPAASSRR